MTMDSPNTYHFDPVDLDLMRLVGQLTPGQRIQRLLDARELLVGMMRGRLRRQYPHLSDRELNLKVLEEIERAKRTPALSTGESYVDAQAHED